jgi:Zn-dependent M28 family amino/carboxypeptidase
MRKLNSKVFLLLIAASALIWTAAIKKAPSDSDKYAFSITAADLRKHLSILASDEYEGRETGERGQKMAAEYIAAFYKALGIPSQADGSWYQIVKLVKISGGDGTFSSKNKSGEEKTYEKMKDFFYTSYAQPIKTNVSEFVFAGYGIDDKNYSDYAAGTAQNKDFYRNKTIMILDGEPVNSGVFKLTGTDKPGMWTTQRRAKMNAAKAVGANVVLVVTEDFEKSKSQAQHSIEGYSLNLDEPVAPNAEPQVTMIYISASMANSLLAQSGSSETVENMRSTINTGGKTISAVYSSNLNINISRKEEKLTTENVLGFVEGTDLKNEIIVVTAHYDHLGIHDGKVFNGADDDGTGTVAVMEMAEAFMQAKKDGKGPRRSMLFMNVSGEEKGLLGSSWYTNHPVYPLENTMCNLNIDMIGRVDDIHSKDSNFVYVIGSAMISSDLKKTLEAANKKHTKLKLDYRFDAPDDPNMFYYRSDHYNFAKKGIPVAFFFNGVHADYHKETDEVSKINFRLMEVRTRLVFYTAWDLANRTPALRRDKLKK